MIKYLSIGGPFSMARQKKPVHRVQLTEGKRNIIHQLLEEYDIQSAEDIQETLKDLLGGTSKEMMETEMDDHLDEIFQFALFFHHIWFPLLQSELIFLHLNRQIPLLTVLGIPSSLAQIIPIKMALHQ
jgi:hypothetical protein